MKRQRPQADRLLTPTEVATRLGVRREYLLHGPPRRVMRWRKLGHRTLRLPESELARFLADDRRKAA